MSGYIRLWQLGLTCKWHLIENGDSLNIPWYTGWTAATENNPGPDISRTKVKCLSLAQGFLEGKSRGSGTPEELAWQRLSSNDNTSTFFLLTLAAGMADPISPQEEIKFDKGKLNRTTRPESGRVGSWNQPPLAAKAGPYTLYPTWLCTAPCWSCYAHSHLNLQPNILITQTRQLLFTLAIISTREGALTKAPFERDSLLWGRKQNLTGTSTYQKKLGNGWEEMEPEK